MEFGIVLVFLILENVVIAVASSGGALGKPTGLKITKPLEPSADHGVIATVTWQPPSNKTLSYYVRYWVDKATNPLQKRVVSNGATLYLKPNTLYVIKVMAMISDQQGPWSSNLNIQTGDSVPTKAPDNVKAIVKDSSSILVTWQPIPKQYHHGKLLGFIVFFRKPNSRKWQRRTISNANTFTYTIAGLLPGESYFVAVAGYTKNGTGKKSVQVAVDRSIPTTVSPTTTPTTQRRLSSSTAQSTTLLFVPTTQETSSSALPTTKEATTPLKTLESNVAKPRLTISTTEPVLATYAYPDNKETQPDHDSVTTGITPADAQANKDIKPKKTSSIELVYKFIVPAAIGGLVLVLIIVCLMWRQRRTKKQRKRQQQNETMSLQTLSETKGGSQKDRSKCEVRRGEGSIRYAPPPKSYNTSGVPQDASCSDHVTVTPNKLAELDAGLTVISETEPGSSQGACAFPDAEPDARKRGNYSVVSTGKQNEDERYIKRSAEKTKLDADPFTISPAPVSPCKSTSSEGRYENMQHLYECLDVKNEETSPLYMNVNGFEGGEDEGEDLYEEIPADRQDSSAEPRENESEIRQPLIDKQKDGEENGDQ